ncbi:helix-turn-helix domain-containing protein [Agromyces albus]|uniref:XRE family transcriptional regulator n=1 Tax=Agromyces albus TaxID=205332 RepID=A0A4Q2KZ32_9MICO|nr:XRE family transcriptional regulator [Agromyces albus]RXZ70287.1 XRE family transcriptional regulator [Agromyces albus]
MHYVTDPTRSLSQAIGVRVKRERTARRWTLDRLAEAASVSRRMVVNVEKGEANPSVATLVRISDALGIGLPSLVETPATSETRITRNGEGSSLWRGRKGGQGILLAGAQTPESLELWEWTMLPDEEHHSDPHAAGTRELLQVRAGTVSVWSGNHVHALSAGDAIVFAGDATHGYANTGTESAVFSLAVFKPDSTKN